MTVTPSFSKAIIALLPKLDVSIDNDLKREILTFPSDQRLPMDLQDALWRALAQQDDGNLGFDIGVRLQPDQYEMVGFLVLSCTQLSKAADMLVSYSQLVGEGGQFYVRHHPKGWVLGYEAQFNAARRMRLQTILAAVLAGVRQVSNEPLYPIEVGMEWGEPGHLDGYRHIFGSAKLSFSQQGNYLIFNNHDWFKHRRHSSPELQQQMVQLAELQLSKLKPQSVKDKVTAILRQQPWLNRTQVAEALAMSERHLNRKLKEFELNYKTLADRIKKQRVKELLDDGKMNQAQMADYFGYANDSAFAKAFRRWMGVSLRAYRRAQKDQHSKDLQ